MSSSIVLVMRLFWVVWLIIVISCCLELVSGCWVGSFGLFIGMFGCSVRISCVVRGYRGFVWV